jgi:NAD(P)-dependent dehydrogenase (short-subunit alcohol dehydrogenase family)
LAVGCDVTNAASVNHAFERVIEAFGGVDILVSNAGAAWQGRIGEVDESVLRQSFELNFYAHQRVAQAAVQIMRARAPAVAFCSMSRSRRSIQAQVSARMGCRKPRRFFSCVNTRWNAAVTGSEPTR